MEMAALHAMSSQALLWGRGHSGHAGDECGSFGPFVGWSWMTVVGWEGKHSTVRRRKTEARRL